MTLLFHLYLLRRASSIGVDGAIVMVMLTTSFTPPPVTNTSMSPSNLPSEPVGVTTPRASRPPNQTAYQFGTNQSLDGLIICVVSSKRESLG